MAEPVGHVGQEGELRPHSLGGCTSLLHIKMIGVWMTVPEGIEHQHPHTGQALHHLRRQELGIGDVTKRSDPKPQRTHPSVRDLQGNDVFAEEPDGRVGIDRMKEEFRTCCGLVYRSPRLKNVVKACDQGIVVIGGKIQGEGTPGSHRKDAQVVDAVQVIRMQMRKPDRIHFGNALADELQTQFGWGIDQEPPSSGKPEKGCMTVAGISRIGGRTGAALAPHHRNSEGCPRPEKGEFEWGWIHSVSTRIVLVVPD